MAKRKVTSGSLASRLTETQREHLLYELIVKGMSYDDAVGLCGDWQVSTTPSSLVRFLDSEGAKWSIERAIKQAEVAARKLPANAEEQARLGLTKRLFEASFADLSVKELAALLRIQVAAKRTENDSRRVAILEQRLKAVSGVVEKAAKAGGFTKETLAEAQQVLGIL